MVRVSDNDQQRYQVRERELTRKLDELRQLPNETEWVEFKVDNYKPLEIGEYISALSNSACLRRKDKGYLVFGIEDVTHNVEGTQFRPRRVKVGNEELENWLARLLNPRIDFTIHEFPYQGSPIVLFEIDATISTPIKFKGEAFIRVGTYKKKLKDYPEKERKIWLAKPNYDWSAQICRGATPDDLDREAIIRARKEYKEKYPRHTDSVDTWDAVKFLNKAKVTIQGAITNAAIILLGKEESEHFISPSVAKISWILRDEENLEKDYRHFGPPFILNVDRFFAKIRNLKYRYMPDGTLFPIEITQYDPWVIREALHNCIAHQDYELRGKIIVVEKPNELMFGNLGHFIPGDVETLIQQDWPPELYRNSFLAQAMVNLNMIDTIGGGIKKMFVKQKERFFPLPDYDLSRPDRVEVKISGKVLDKNYTSMLINKTDLDLSTVILLDKVQKRIRITSEQHLYLRKQNLTEGRYPNVYVSARIASVTGEKAKYIKYRAFDKRYYQDLVISYLKKHKQASRKDIDDLLLNKMPDILDNSQKRTKIKNLIYEMSIKLGSIHNVGSIRKPKWILTIPKKKNKL